MAPTEYSLNEFIARKWPALVLIGFVFGVMLIDNWVDIV
jgi:hypothetical protein